MRLSDKAYQIISPKVKRSKVLLGYKICRYKSLSEKTDSYVRIWRGCEGASGLQKTFPIACGRPVHIYQNISEWENNLESENLNRAARLPSQTNSFKYCSKVKPFYILFSISQWLALKNFPK